MSERLICVGQADCREKGIDEFPSESRNREAGGSGRERRRTGALEPRVQLGEGELLAAVIDEQADARLAEHAHVLPSVAVDVIERRLHRTRALRREGRVRNLRVKARTLDVEEDIDRARGVARDDQIEIAVAVDVPVNRKVFAVAGDLITQGWGSHGHAD